MEKVKITKEQAQKIEELKAKYGTEKFYYEHIRSGRWTCACLNEIKPFEMARILLEGYEIAFSPASSVNERIAEIGNTIIICEDHKRILDAEMRGIKLVVKAFELEGVRV